MMLVYHASYGQHAFLVEDTETREQWVVPNKRGRWPARERYPGLEGFPSVDDSLDPAIARVILALLGAPTDRPVSAEDARSYVQEVWRRQDELRERDLAAAIARSKRHPDAYPNRDAKPEPRHADIASIRTRIAELAEEARGRRTELPPLRQGRMAV